MSEQNAKASALILRPTLTLLGKESPFWDMALDIDNHPNLLQSDAFDSVRMHMRVTERL
jgi:hypothetical protein